MHTEQMPEVGADGRIHVEAGPEFLFPHAIFLIISIHSRAICQECLWRYRFSCHVLSHTIYIVGGMRPAIVEHERTNSEPTGASTFFGVAVRPAPSPLQISHSAIHFSFAYPLFELREADFGDTHVCSLSVLRERLNHFAPRRAAPRHFAPRRAPRVAARPNRGATIARKIAP